MSAQLRNTCPAPGFTIDGATLGKHFAQMGSIFEQHGDPQGDFYLFARPTAAGLEVYCSESHFDAQGRAERTLPMTFLPWGEIMIEQGKPLIEAAQKVLAIAQENHARYGKNKPLTF